MAAHGGRWYDEATLCSPSFLCCYPLRDANRSDICLWGFAAMSQTTLSQPAVDASPVSTADTGEHWDPLFHTAPDWQPVAKGAPDPAKRNAIITWATILVVFVGLTFLAANLMVAMEKNKKTFRQIKVTQPISLIDQTYVAPKK